MARMRPAGLLAGVAIVRVPGLPDLELELGPLTALAGPRPRKSRLVSVIEWLFAGRPPIVVAGVAHTWSFWLKRPAGVRATVVSDGYQERMILVKGGDTPDSIRGAARRLVRLLFRGEKTAACSEQVVLPDSASQRSCRPPRSPLEFLAREPGSNEFTYQMSMLRGQPRSGGSTMTSSRDDHP